jgi:hypothetical protein
VPVWLSTDQFRVELAIQAVGLVFRLSDPLILHRYVSFTRQIAYGVESDGICGWDDDGLVLASLDCGLTKIPISPIAQSCRRHRNTPLF